jgi:hypothetical protein
VYGPPTYAFQVGRVHFVVLDDVIYAGWNAQAQQPGRYEGGFREDQLDFVRNYLHAVPRRDLVVLAVHIPLDGFDAEYIPQRRALFEVLAGHPHTLSLSAHSHVQYHHFFGTQDGGAAGRTHHHLNRAAAAGSWWRAHSTRWASPTRRCATGHPTAIPSSDSTATPTAWSSGRRAGPRTTR